MNNKQKRSVNKKDIKNNRKYFEGSFSLWSLQFLSSSLGAFLYSVIHRADGQNLQKSYKLYDAETGSLLNAVPSDSNQQPVAEDTTTYSIYIKKHDKDL